MNVFIKPEIADQYDAYYKTEAGKQVDEIEKQLIAAALQKCKGRKMLELGCGTGHWTRFFVEKEFELTATDISDAMLKHAKQKQLNAAIVKADAENLPFENESFDVVASITMMEFVRDQNKVLAEIYRVLKPNGYVLLGGLNSNSELAKNVANDSVFKNANFFTRKSLVAKLMQFGNPEVSCGVRFSATFQLMDASDEKDNYEPAFLLALVQKIK